MKLLQDSNRDLLLFYPSVDAISLKDALKLIKQRRSEANASSLSSDISHRNNSYSSTRRSTTEQKERTITLLFLDATWKYAQEMDKSCTQYDMYPSHMIRVKLDPIKDADGMFVVGGTNVATISQFQPGRFSIRTPPTPKHLSTTECIAWVVSIVEENRGIYDTLMRPLDLMVKCWFIRQEEGEK